jgi:hypothetical protein
VNPNEPFIKSPIAAPSGAWNVKVATPSFSEVVTLEIPVSN